MRTSTAASFYSHCIGDLGGIGNPNTTTSQEAEERSPLESGLDLDTTIILYTRWDPDSGHYARITCSGNLAAPALLLVLAAAWSRLPEPSQTHTSIPVPTTETERPPTHPARVHPPTPVPLPCTAPTPPLRSPDSTRVIVPVPRPTAYRRRKRTKPAARGRLPRGRVVWAVRAPDLRPHRIGDATRTQLLSGRWASGPHDPARRTSAPARRDDNNRL